jgi:hypothetical protein
VIPDIKAPVRSLLGGSSPRGRAAAIRRVGTPLAAPDGVY